MDGHQVEWSKVFKAVFLISLVPVTFIILYAASGRMQIDHAVIGIIFTLVSITFFIYPYLSNIKTLTHYVNNLSEDEIADQPDLSFLNNLEELSDAVEHLNKSWHTRKGQLEAALAENKIVIEVLPDALFILDGNQKILRTNGMARQMFGNRLTGKKLEDVINVENFLTAVRHVDQAREIEFNIIDGQIRRDYVAKITKFPSSTPTSTDTILTLHDLTELKQIRKMRADFVANASHEMKTPLASIIGLIEIMQTTAKGDEKAKADFLKIMSEQADRMKRLIADLLSLSKIEADTSAPETKVDLLKILPEVKKHCDFIAQLRNVKIKMDLPRELPLIIGDEEQIGQVFVNLISNSVKYGASDSEIKIEAKVTRKLPIELSEKYDKAIEISILDKGEGIPPDHIPRLTERFYRVDTARTRKLGGTGLGLAIVKHVLNRHSGVLKIESELGKGSKFSVFLPLGDDHLILRAAEGKIKT